VKVTKDAKIKLETCLAHFMLYYEAKKKQQHFERYNMELTETFYFKNYYDDLKKGTHDEYAEYRRQREILERALGYDTVDQIMEIAFRKWREGAEKTEADAYTWEYQRDVLNCAVCAHNGSADDKNFCDVFTKGTMPGLFLSKCPGFQEIKQPMD
jgi:hypothetical protein